MPTIVAIAFLLLTSLTLASSSGARGYSEQLSPDFGGHIEEDGGAPRMQESGRRLLIERTVADVLGDAKKRVMELHQSLGCARCKRRLRWLVTGKRGGLLPQAIAAYNCGKFKLAKAKIILAISSIKVCVRKLGPSLFTEVLRDLEDAMEVLAEAMASSSKYRKALHLSLLFLEAQRSGKLPESNRVTWRGDSGLKDGMDNGVDLTGGYYDAGDNVKFNMPMAFTVTTLAWSVLEFHKYMGLELKNVRDAVRWGTDYLLKCWKPEQKRLYIQVGDGNKDHKCWSRPEDMDEGPIARPSFFLNATRRGTEIACETAAALAAASLVFKNVDCRYSEKLLKAAREIYAFGTEELVSYGTTLGPETLDFYSSFTGYDDDVLWASVWLYKATEKESKYRAAIEQWSASFDPSELFFSWDSKSPGAAVLLHGLSLSRDSNISASVWGPRADSYVCAFAQPRRDPEEVPYLTPSGLQFFLPFVNFQYVTAAQLAVMVYRKNSIAVGRSTIATCNKTVADLRSWAVSQAEFILGHNPRNFSYMVGFGARFPQRVHHRAASIPTPTPSSNATLYTCLGGFAFYNGSTTRPNAHVLLGAIVGGPSFNGVYEDQRSNFVQNEPTTYVNSAAVGAFASLLGP